MGSIRTDITSPGGSTLGFLRDMTDIWESWSRRCFHFSFEIVYSTSSVFCILRLGFLIRALLSFKYILTKCD